MLIWRGEEEEEEENRWEEEKKSTKDIKLCQKIKLRLNGFHFLTTTTKKRK